MAAPHFQLAHGERIDAAVRQDLPQALMPDFLDVVSLPRGMRRLARMTSGLADEVIGRTLEDPFPDGDDETVRSDRLENVRLSLWSDGPTAWDDAFPRVTDKTSGGDRRALRIAQRSLLLQQRNEAARIGARLVNYLTTDPDRVIALSPEQLWRELCKTAFGAEGPARAREQLASEVFRGTYLVILRIAELQRCTQRFLRDTDGSPESRLHRLLPMYASDYIFRSSPVVRVVPLGFEVQVHPEDMRYIASESAKGCWRLAPLDETGGAVSVTVLSCPDSATEDDLRTMESFRAHERSHLVHYLVRLSESGIASMHPSFAAAMDLLARNPEALNVCFGADSGRHRRRFAVRLLERLRDEVLAYGAHDVWSVSPDHLIDQEYGEAIKAFSVQGESLPVAAADRQGESLDELLARTFYYRYLAREALDGARYAKGSGVAGDDAAREDRALHARMKLHLTSSRKLRRVAELEPGDRLVSYADQGARALAGLKFYRSCTALFDELAEHFKTPDGAAGSARWEKMILNLASAVPVVTEVQFTAMIDTLNATTDVMRTGDARALEALRTQVEARRLLRLSDVSTLLPPEALPDLLEELESGSPSLCIVAAESVRAYLETYSFRMSEAEMSRAQEALTKSGQ